MSKRDYFKAIPAVYVIFRRGSEILMLRRHQTTYFDDHLSLPAGHVEQGESLKGAAIREVKEEVDIELKTKNLVLSHVLNRPTHENDGGTRLDFFFTAQNWTGQPTNNEPEKCSELVWCNLDHLPKDVIPEVHQAISEVAKGNLESEFGWS